MVNGRGEGVCRPLEAASGFVLPDLGGPECHVLGAIVASRWDRWRLPPAVCLAGSHLSTPNTHLRF